MNAPRTLTNDEKIVNCLLALVRWSKVSPAKVVPNLGKWHCGTQACFGGHLVTWEEFREMGVLRVKRSERQPVIPGLELAGHRYHFQSRAVGEHLFGHPDIFYSRDMTELDAGASGLSDHALVAHRLERQIEELSS